MSWIKAIWERIRMVVALAGAVVAMLLGIHTNGKRSARREAEMEALKDGLTASEKAQINRREVETMDDAAVLREFERLYQERRHRR